MVPFNLDITEKASAEIQAAIAGESDASDLGVRLICIRTGKGRYSCGLDFTRISRKRHDDLLLLKDGISLLINEANQEHLSGATLRWVENDDGEGFKFDIPGEGERWDDPLAEKLEDLIHDEIGPNLARHGGTVELVDFKETVASVRMGGGCQGCGDAEMTLRNGIIKRVHEVLPGISKVVDLTDHEAGKNPWRQ